MAVRETTAAGSAVYYLLGDHLGSTSVTADSAGDKLAELRYRPWGGLRYAWGDPHSDYRYTGQRYDSYINLYWYGSRWYDGALGRFSQPDMLVPLASQGTQAWDRYAGMNNNPVKYNDPTGHDAGCPGMDASECGVGSKLNFGRGKKSIDELLSGLAGKKISWDRLSREDQSTFRDAVWTPSEYNDFASGTVTHVEGTLQDPAVLTITFIGAGRLTPGAISLLKQFFQPVEVTSTYVVYQLVENGVTRYVGITNNILQRTEQHFVNRGWLIEPIYGLSKPLLFT